VPTTDDDEPLAAGEFGVWLSAMRDALRGDGESDVPCDGCSACCTSSKFVHIEPDETDTLARIPSALLFPAPLMPKGHVLMGYDDRGHCPMLVDGRCSIYDHRPRTCRVYDCRVFAAAALAVDDGKGAIDRRVRRWCFDYATDADRARHRAVETAAAFLERHENELGDLAPRTSTARAIAAIELCEHFEGAGVGAPTPRVEEVRVELGRRRR
jgi:hypothetical protein